MQRKSTLTIAIATAVLAVLGATTVDAQDKYSLTSPGGIAFSDFKGYEDWAVVSSARTDEVLKVIVANPTMIEAYKTDIPGNGQPFPDGSKIVKLQWKPKKRHGGPLRRGCCQTSSRRLSSSKRTARDFRKAVGGDTRCSTTKPHRTSSQPIPAPRTADTRAMWP
jgi:Cytochrome P460